MMTRLEQSQEQTKKNSLYRCGRRMTKEELEKQVKKFAISYWRKRNRIGDNFSVLDLINFTTDFATEATKELEAQIEKMKWHKLDWDKAEENPDVDKLVRVRTRSGAEYICETYSYFPAEDEIGYGSVITQFSELNGDWVDDNEIEYWCYIEPFKEIKENDRPKTRSTDVERNKRATT